MTKYHIRETTCTDRKKPPCEGCKREIFIQKASDGAVYHQPIWTIEIDDLVEFTNKIECPIILGDNWPEYGMPNIEIYDDSREEN